MRLWSIHPKYLDPKGLVALWREGLLAQKVLLGQTKGYRHHPQLDRFYACDDPVVAIGAYLAEVVREAQRRGYNFDESKVAMRGECARIAVTSGQLDYEWAHLVRKLGERAPDLLVARMDVVAREPHPLFHVVPGEIEGWERRWPGDRSVRSRR